MGTLDEAIRQHLELKRRAGAPGDEVDRLQTEAFGSATAAPVEAAPPPPPVEHPVEDVAPPPLEAAEPAVPEVPAAPRQEDPWLEDDDEESQGTSEFTAAEAREATGATPADFVAPDEEGEDLLEETPDFLQETPEHDRLWFEQKPPRDFDFDS